MSQSQPTDSQLQKPQRRLKTPEERFGAQDFGPRSAPGEVSPLRENVVLPPENPTEAPRPARKTAANERGAHERKTHERQHHERTHHERGHHERHHHERTPIAGHENSAPPTPKTPIAPRAVVRPSPFKRFAKRVLVLGTAIFGFSLGASLLSAPQFAVDSILVEGVEQTDAQKVRELALELKGQNIFRANRAQVVKRIEALPTVANAQISRVWSFPPSLKLAVSERQPFLRVGAGNSWFVADKNGVPFRAAHSGDEDLFALTAPQFSPQLGKALPAKPWARAKVIGQALESDNALAREDGAAAWNLRRVYMDKNGLVSLRISGSETLVRLGDDDWQKKLGRARLALGYFAQTGRDAEELNLLSFQNPRWKPRLVANSSQPRETRDG